MLDRDGAGRAERIALHGAQERIVRGEELREVLAHTFGPRAVKSTWFEIQRTDRVVSFRRPRLRSRRRALPGRRAGANSLRREAACRAFSSTSPEPNSSHSDQRRLVIPSGQWTHAAQSSATVSHSAALARPDAPVVSDDSAFAVDIIEVISATLQPDPQRQ